MLSKFGGNGLFGLVGYTAPDPNKNLVIMTWMPSEHGTKNRCWVRISSVSFANTPRSYIARTF